MGFPRYLRSQAGGHRRDNRCDLFTTAQRHHRAHTTFQQRPVHEDPVDSEGTFRGERMIQGTATAIVTPFKENGEVDEEGLRTLVTFQEQNGVDFIVPVGTDGRIGHALACGASQGDQDRRRPGQEGQGHCGSGSNSTSEAIHLSRGAKDLGCSPSSPYPHITTSRRRKG